MSPEELNKCLKTFYVSARKRDGSFYNKKSLTAIRAAVDRHLRNPPVNKPFSIIGDSRFSEANKTLSNFLKTLSKSGKIAPTVHKRPLTKELVNKLYEDGELVESGSLHPSKLQQTAWFYITLFLGKRGRENQQSMTKNLLILRKTPSGLSYFELNKDLSGTVLATKNHQGGLDDKEDLSNGKIFEAPKSMRCPVQTIQQYLSHLNQKSDNLFQKPRNPCKTFNPAKDNVWYSSAPLGHNTLENMLRGMTSRAGINPYLTNHSIRATTVTVLSSSNIESRHIKAITGHQSDTSIESYCETPTFQQFKTMSNILSNFLHSDHSCDGDAQSNVINDDSQAVVSTSTPAAIPSVSSADNFSFAAHDLQNSSRAFVTGGTFHNCNLNFNVNFPGRNSQQNM